MFQILYVFLCVLFHRVKETDFPEEEKQHQKEQRKKKQQIISLHDKHCVKHWQIEYSTAHIRSYVRRQSEKERRIHRHTHTHNTNREEHERATFVFVQMRTVK